MQKKSHLCSGILSIASMDGVRPDIAFASEPDSYYYEDGCIFFTLGFRVPRKRKNAENPNTHHLRQSEMRALSSTFMLAHIFYEFSKNAIQFQCFGHDYRKVNFIFVWAFRIFLPEKLPLRRARRISSLHR